MIPSLLWQGSAEALQQFKTDARSRGLRILQGGRFLHLLGDMDKGRAVQQLLKWYQSKGRNDILTLGLGDSGNDSDMLLNVDIPIIIKKKDGTHLDLPQRADAIITELSGPAGWNQALNRLMDNQGD